ncbi:MAG: hypothetical protein LUG17_01965 [Clostridiales bacterium]|nr:hypothetical protein [Clostridiales bacterium]MCD7843375.1 hypothetical protein [Clostridiales bacterium]
MTILWVLIFLCIGLLLWSGQKLYHIHMSQTDGEEQTEENKAAEDYALKRSGVLLGCMLVLCLALNILR